MYRFQSLYRNILTLKILVRGKNIFSYTEVIQTLGDVKYRYIARFQNVKVSQFEAHLIRNP